MGMAWSHGLQSPESQDSAGKVMGGSVRLSEPLIHSCVPSETAASALSSRAEAVQVGTTVKAGHPSRSLPREKVLSGCGDCSVPPKDMSASQLSEPVNRVFTEVNNKGSQDEILDLGCALHPRTLVLTRHTIGETQTQGRPHENKGGVEGHSHEERLEEAGRTTPPQPRAFARSVALRHPDCGPLSPEP